MKHQLILTSLDKNLDNNRRPVLLGDWCLKYKERTFWEGIEYEISSDVWDQNSRQEDIDTYCLDLINRLNLSLAETLNDFHNEIHTIRYWNFVLLPWMYDYVYKWYKCYMEIVNVIEKYSDLKINLLKMNETKFPFNESSITIENKNEGNISELYHWGIYTRIVKEFVQKKNIQIEKFDFPFEIVKKDIPLLEEEKSFDLKRKLKRVYLKIFKKAPIYFYGFFGGKDFKKIRWENLGRVLFLDSPKAIYESKYDINIRKNMKLGFEPDNDFEKILKKNILIDLPEYMVENYNDLVKFREENFQAEPKIVITQSSSIAGEDSVSFAEWYEKKVDFFFIAHSPTSALIKKNYLETLFLLGCKKYSWGYCHDERNIVCPSFKDYEFGNRRVHTGGKKLQILWCGCGISVQMGIYRSLYESGYKSAKERKEALDNYIACLQFMNNRVKDYLLYRPRDIGNFGMEEIFKKYVSNLKVDKEIKYARSVSMSVRETLLDRFEESRLVICESLVTSVFYEALNMNIPVIVIEKDIYSDVNEYYFYEDVLSYFMELKRNGIWYESGEEAAYFINENYDRIEEWWLMPERQEIRKRLLDRCFMHTNDLTDWWKKEFKRLMLSTNLPEG